MTESLDGKLPEVEYKNSIYIQKIMDVKVYLDILNFHLEVKNIDILDILEVSL